MTRRRSALLVGTALTAMAAGSHAGAQPAPGARPTGGQVVAGSASISQTANATTITQTTARAALDWRSFDVGSQQTVRFAQPSSAASTLNRVTGPDPSQIAGKIQANGQVVLVNQSGVVFTRGAQVDVAGLVVSAAGITNQNFMAGAMKFDQPARPNARVENHGRITVREAGLAALVAPQVANSGVISAKLGHVVLAGAETATLDMYGDGLLAIDVTGQVRQSPADAAGKRATALVTNTGTLIAEGGTVRLTARAADGIVQTLVDAGGRIAAPSVGGRTGMIALQGVGGSVVISGQVEAVGARPGERGGRIGVNATEAVRLASGAALNASGRAGGGTVAFGTTFARAAGGPGVTARRTARRAVVEPGAVIAADATERGRGGRVTVLSLEQTDMGGAIAARGGSLAGNGGFVEVSGGAGFALTGGIDVSAPAGHFGAILLDPNDLDIVASDTSVGITVGGGTVTASAGAAMVNSGTLQQLGASADVTVIASGTLDVQTNVAVTHGLSLQAGGLLMVDPAVTLAAGAGSALGLTAGAALSLGAGSHLSGGSIALSGSSVALADALVDAGPGTVRITTTTGDATQTPGGIINAGLLNGSVVGTASLVGANAITTLGGFDASALTLRNTSDLRISGTVNAGSAATITQTGTLTVAGALNAGTIDLRAGEIGIPGSILGTLGVNLVASLGSIDAPGQLVTPLLTGSAAKQAGFAGSNAIGALGSFVAAGLTLANTLNLQVLGIVNGGSVASISEAGTLSVGAGASLNAGTISLGAAAIVLAGSLAGLGRIDLRTTSGGVTETGGISTGLLTGSIAAGATLTGANTIGALGSFAAADLALTDSGALIVSGPLDGAILDLRAASIDVPGAIHGTGGVNLVASNGSIQATGSVVTPLLTGSATGTASFTGANAIDGLGGFVATGFTLTDGSALRIGGIVNAGSAALIGAAGTLTVAAGGAVNAGTIALNAGAIGLDGALHGTGVDLVTTTGSVTETGGITAASLTGSIAAGATLTGANTIAALGSFAATDLTLTDGGALIVSGPLDGAILDLRAASIDVPGAIHGTSGVNLVASNGSIQATGSIVTPLLTGSATGTASFTGANAIDGLGGFVATGFTLADGSALRIGGIVNAGSAALIGAAGTLAVAASGAVNAGTIALNAGAIGLDGALHGSGIDLVTTTGSVTETGGISAGLLTGSIAAGATLTGANTIGALGNFAATDLTLTSGSPLQVSGSVLAGTIRLDAASLAISGRIAAAGSLDLTTNPGGVTEAGGITTPLLTGRITAGATLTGTNTIAALGGFVAAGLDLADASDLLLTGLLAASTVNLGANSVTESGGAINAGRLSGSVATGAALVGANTIGVLGDFTARDLTLADGHALQAAGAVNAGTINLSAPDLSIPGRLAGASGVTLTATTGAIAETGTILTPLLVAAAVGGASLTGTVPTANAIATLGGLSAGGDVAVFDGAPLAITGAVIAGAGRTIALRADSLSIQAPVVASAGTVAIGPASTGANMSLGAVAPAGTLSLVQADLNQIATGATGTLALGGTDARHMLAGTLSIAGRVSIGPAIGGTLALYPASGAVEAGTLNVTTLTGTTSGSVSLDTANAIATLGDFSASGLILRDISPLTIGGVVNSRSIALNADGIVLSGALNGSDSVDLRSGAAIDETGVIATPLLTGSAVGLTSLTGQNAILALGGFVSGGLVLNDAAGLIVAGLVDAGPQVAITDAVSLSIAANAALTAGAVSLAAPVIGIAGGVSGTASVDLRAGAGGIAETGIITTPLLTGATTGAAVLGGPNGVGTLGGFSANGFSFVNAQALAVTGPVDGAASASIVAGGSLAVAGSVAAGSVALSGLGVAINGVVSAPGLVSLSAAGSIAEDGAVNAGTLTGTAGGDAFLAGTNALGVLGNFSAASFTLADGQGLRVAGLLDGGARASLAVNGALAINGSVRAGMVDLRAATIGETGAIVAGTLSGASAGSTSLTGVNAIGTLGGFSAAGLTLADTQSLRVTGPVLGGPSVAITDGMALSVPGQIQADTIVLAGSSIDIAGSLAGREAVRLASAARIDETGAISTALLTGSAGAGAALLGANSIATLGDFSAHGLTLNAGPGLLVSGPVNGDAAVTITDAGALTVAGEIDASTVALSGASIGIPGFVNAPMGLSLIAGSGGIAETGQIRTGSLTGAALGAASLTGTNAIASLADFSATGLTLADVGNLLVSGAVRSGPEAVVSASGLLTVAGSVGASSVSLSASALDVPGVLVAPVTAGLIAGNGGITETGSIATANLTGSATGAASFTGRNAIGAVGAFSAAGLAINDAADLTIAGPIHADPSLAITDSGALGISGAIEAAVISLDAASITATGVLTTALLGAKATGDANFSGTNAIGALGNSTMSSLVLRDASDLRVAGIVNGGSSVAIAGAGALDIAGGGAVIGGLVGMSASRIGIAGVVGGTTGVRLSAAGSIDATGAVVTPELDGVALGPVNLGGANRIGSFGDFSVVGPATGSFRLENKGDLLLKGRLSANLIVLDNGNGQIILGDGALIETGGTSRPPGAFQAPPQANGGAYLTDFVQLGASHVTGLGGGPAILSVTANGAGGITFDSRAGNGLFGPDTWLILTLGDAAAPGSLGSASGNVFVRSLDFRFFGTGGQANLTGTIANLAGQVAAGSGNISPGTNTIYRFNSCPIHSVNCVILPTEGLPPVNPLQEFSIGGLSDASTDDDLLLPIVSDRDY